MRYRSLDSLKESIKEEPMNRERFDYVIKYRMNGLVFTDETKNSIAFKDLFRIFYINPKENLEKQIKRFLHAIGHSYRDISIFKEGEGIRKDAGSIERLINEDMDKYYKKDRKYVIKTFSKTKELILENKITYS